MKKKALNFFRIFWKESGELKERVDYDKLVTTAYAQKAAEK